jgi:hypothetical protein
LPDQGHGWGYRYLHGLIGSLALIGTAGWVQMERLHGTAFRQPVMLCFAMTLAVVIPVRAFLIERTIAPWLVATEAARAMPADVVIVDRLAIYNAHDLLRSGPYAAERPVVMTLWALSADQVRCLCSDYRVAFFDGDEAQQAGLPTFKLEEALPRATGMDAEIREKAADYREKYRFLSSGACTHLRAQQRINGTSGNSTVGMEVP